MAEVLILTAHPQLEHSRVNLALMQAALALPRERVAVRDLYALYPDFHIDVEAERSALVKAKLVVWQHPLHWYAMPPLLKLWLDEVLAFGWAYGPGGTALRGKDLWLAVSTGGSAEAYHPSGHNRHFIDAFWPPCEQTAALTGMRFLPPLVFHGAHAATPTAIARHASLFANRLSTYPDWPELADLPENESCLVPPTDRPQPAAAAAGAERRAAPKPAPLPPGDRPGYSQGEGSSASRASPKPAPVPSGDRPGYPQGEGLQ